MAGHRHPELKFERARIDRARLNLFAASRPPVVETRFSFLLTAAAVTPSKRMQFHPSGSSFSLTREKFTASPCYSASARYFGHRAMLLKKCKLTRGLPYLWDARCTCAHARIGRPQSLSRDVDSFQWLFFFDAKCRSKRMDTDFHVPFKSKRID